MKKVLSGLAMLAGIALLSGNAQAAGLTVNVTVTVSASVSIAWEAPATDPVALANLAVAAVSTAYPAGAVPNIVVSSDTGSSADLSVNYTQAGTCTLAIVGLPANPVAAGTITGLTATVTTSALTPIAGGNLSANITAAVH